uniref:Ig-like domain-containing protein n=1 Tax=Junco hyemalis TaxID=40217 RepID=A0A8C5IFE6_JUNHY
VSLQCLWPILPSPSVPCHTWCTPQYVTLRCSVQVGSAPVTFTWLDNGQEVAQGPLLELSAVDAGHSGTYQCVVTNQLDGHQALSSELALEVTTQEQGAGRVTQGHMGSSGPPGFWVTLMWNGGPRD